MTPREQEEYRALRATIRERGTARVWLCVIGFGIWATAMIAAAALSPTPVSVLLPLLLLAVVFEAVLALHVGVERIGRYVQVFYEDEEGRALPRNSEFGMRNAESTDAAAPSAGSVDAARPLKVTRERDSATASSVPDPDPRRPVLDTRERDGASASGVGVGPHAIELRRWEHAAMEFGRPRGAIGVDPLFTALFALAAVINVAPALVLEPVRSELIVVAGAHLLFFVRLLYARTSAARQRAVDLERFQQLKQRSA